MPSGVGPKRFCIEAGGHRVGGQVSPKGMRKAVAMIAEHGAERVPDDVWSCGCVATDRFSAGSAGLVAAAAAITTERCRRPISRR